MIEAGLDIPIGYMPSGSTNDFAEFHNISSDVLTAARHIAEGSERRVDVGKLGGKYFINAADFGAFTWLPYTTPQRLKNKLGFYAHVLDGIRDLSKLQSEHLRIRINGQTVEGEYIFGIVASSSSLAGAMDFFGQKVVADDGLFEVLLLRYPDGRDRVCRAACRRAVQEAYRAADRSLPGHGHKVHDKPRRLPADS